MCTQFLPDTLHSSPLHLSPSLVLFTCSYFSIPTGTAPFWDSLSSKQLHCPPAASQAQVSPLHNLSALLLYPLTEKLSCGIFKIPLLELAPSPRDPTEPAATATTLSYICQPKADAQLALFKILCSSISALPATQLSSDSFCCLVIISIMSNLLPLCNLHTSHTLTIALHANISSATQPSFLARCLTSPHS